MVQPAVPWVRVRALLIQVQYVLLLWSRAAAPCYNTASHLVLECLIHRYRVHETNMHEMQHAMPVAHDTNVRLAVQFSLFTFNDHLTFSFLSILHYRFLFLVLKES
jgi:hypothetical protein